MGNEDKVKNVVVETKNTFLREDLAQMGGETQIYSLEDEFAKTKKNKSHKMNFLVFLFILLLGIIAFLIALQADKRTQRIEVGISDFQDLNLVELLSSAQDSATKLRGLQIELQDLRSEMEREIEKVKQNTERQIQLVQNRNISDAERQRQIAQLTQNQNNRIAQITANYDARIAEKEDEIAEAQQAVEQSQLEAMDAAHRQQRIADNYDRLNEIKLQEQAKVYEEKIRNLERQHQRDLDAMEKYYKQLTDVLIQKFNPIFRIDELIKARTSMPDLSSVNNLISDTVRNYSGTNALDLKPYMSELGSEGVMNEAGFRTLRNRIQFYGVLFNRLNEIPFTNTVVPAMADANSLYRSVVLDYDKLWFDLANRIRVKNQLISQYLYALNFYSKLNRDSGYVLDPRDRNNIVVFIQDFYQIGPAGVPAIIFRGDNEFIANVKVFPTATGYKATIVDMPETNHIQPLDKILLRLQEEQQ